MLQWRKPSWSGGSGWWRAAPRSREAVDQARAAYERDKARVAELEAELKTAQLGARTDEIQAAEAEVTAARAQLAQAEWRLDQMSQAAPQAAIVVDTLYRPGEWIAAGAPVVSLLPPENVKVRFFVPSRGSARSRSATRCTSAAMPAQRD